MASDRATIVDTCATPETPVHDERGWLTAESYLAWIAGSERVLMGDRPFAQPPCLPPDADDEQELALDRFLLDLIAA